MRSDKLHIELCQRYLRQRCEDLLDLETGPVSFELGRVLVVVRQSKEQ